jgi:predicted transcriptional regulator
MTSNAEPTPAIDNALRMASEIVAAYVSFNTIPVDQLSEAITLAHKTLVKLQSSDPNAADKNQKPAVPVGRSITAEYIVCLEDGRKLKMLKRHLRTRYNLSPDEYRVKWGLPPDYPMVAPNYSAQRSEFVRKIGLDQKSGGRIKKSKKK